jgi:hypothetical protein
MRSSEGTAAGETQTLIGRAGERARLLALVERERVVAVVGPAGVGKSALVRDALPDAHVMALADCRDDAELDARLAAAEAAAVVVCEDVPAGLLARVIERARRRRGGVVVVVSRVGADALPTIELGPLSDRDARALAAALDADDPLQARIAAGGNPGEIARRWAAARAAVAPVADDALAALWAGRFGDALDGDPMVAAAALCGLDALDRAQALVQAHAQHPRAPLAALALLWRRGELRACAERGERLMATLEDAGDTLGHAITAAIVARAAFGLGEITRAEALLRTVNGMVAGGRAPAIAAFADLGRMLVAAFRGDWDEARRRVARAHVAAPASSWCAVERSWADGAAATPPLDDAARALFDLRAAERALADGRLDEANLRARDAERFWRDAGAGYDRALALVARAEALVRAGDRAPADKLRQACAALADTGGYRIVGTALALVDAYAADRDGALAEYVAALARARALAGAELCGRALVEACARVGLPRPAAVADGQPMRDRVTRLGLDRAADRLCSVGRELRLVAEDEPLPPADAVADVDEGTLTAGGREQPLAPQLMLLLEAIAAAGGDGVTPEELHHAVWRTRDEYHPLRHRNAVYVAVNRLRGALEPIAGKEALRSTATHYALAPGLRIAVVRAVRRLDVAAFAGRAADGLDAPGYARRHGLPESQARWELALHAAAAAR